MTDATFISTVALAFVLSAAVLIWGQSLSRRMTQAALAKSASAASRRVLQLNVQRRFR